MARTSSAGWERVGDVGGQDRRENAEVAIVSRGATGARPSMWWFVLGASLIVGSALAFVALLVLTLTRASQTDDVVTVPGPGAPVVATVQPDAQRMLFVVRGQPSPECVVTDANGAAVPLDPVSAEVIVGGGTEWQGVATFAATTPQIELTCSQVVAGQQVRVGAPLDVRFVGGILITVFVPLFLGGTGVVIVVVTLIRRLTAARPSS